MIRNVLAKFQAKLISKDTALEEMRYLDPSTEMEKIRAESIEEANLAKQIEAGMVEQKYFDDPKKEEDYMLVENKMAMPHPNQDHQVYIDSHLERYKITPSNLFIQNIMLRKKMM